MRPNSRQLALRDSALAAQLGILAHNGSNFGSEFSGEFSADFEGDYEFGDEMDGDFAADPAPAAIPKPTAQQALAAYRNQMAAKVNRNKRMILLQPNRGSDVKVERYTFTIDTPLTIGGGAVAFLMTGQPDTQIRPQILSINAPSVMFATITEIKVANVSVSIGVGAEDAYNYSPLAPDRHLDMPTLTPANRATVRGNYSNYVPPGFAVGMVTTLSASFKGPASIVA